MLVLFHSHLGNNEGFKISNMLSKKRLDVGIRMRNREFRVNIVLLDNKFKKG